MARALATSVALAVLAAAAMAPSAATADMASTADTASTADMASTADTASTADMGATGAVPDDWEYQLTEEQYYAMPALYHLDAYDSCISRHQLYCLGSFQLDAAGPHQLFTQMQRYSTNFVDHFDHTQLHRGACVSRRCPRAPHRARDADPGEWFESCINSSLTAQYNLTASLSRLEYCRRGGVGGAVSAGGAGAPALGASERGLAGLAAALLALAAACTVLDLTLPDHAKKGAEWALAWSLPGCWRALHQPPSAGDLRLFDGVRVVCMLCVIIEHVVWLAMLAYNSQPRFIEEVRRSYDVMLLTNSTLVVQLFFCLSSFLLAHKLLLASGKGTQPPVVSTFFRTMLNRVIRISPSYYVVVWLAASWWPRLSGGPLWSPMVGAEADVCRRKWWTHLLYLNNVVYPDDKCLIQTWYLAADMQLYAFCLLLTLGLLRCRRHALHVLCGLLALVLTALAAMAYTWQLVPTFMLHRPEVVRAQYRGSLSFNILYQSPLGNMPGALAGLILVHLHHAMLRADMPPRARQWFNWVSWLSFPLAFCWVMLSPYLVWGGRPGAAAVALAVAERPVFLLLIGCSMLGALHGVSSPWGACLSWSGWRTPARLSFAALLLHMPLNKTLLAARPTPATLDRPEAVFQWCGVALLAYLLAVPLTLLVELPCQRLHRALTAPAHPCKPHPHPHPEDNNHANHNHTKTDH